MSIETIIARLAADNANGVVHSVESLTSLISGQSATLPEGTTHIIYSAQFNKKKAR